jgi:bromodomain adjacent to zinc finger domain protein 1A
MPLLNKTRFVKKPVPRDINPNEEIFYSKLTHEMFRDYDEYFERTILCNSLVWTCNLTGKTGLTYAEAVESEERAVKSLATFPRILERTLIFLISRTNRGNIKDLTDDIFTFVKDRYFIGEQVKLCALNSKADANKTFEILDVILPPVSAAVETSADAEVMSVDGVDENKDDIENEPKQKQTCAIGKLFKKKKIIFLMLIFSSVGTRSNSV